MQFEKSGQEASSLFECEGGSYGSTIEKGRPEAYPDLWTACRVTVRFIGFVDSLPICGQPAASLWICGFVDSLPRHCAFYWHFCPVSANQPPTIRYEPLLLSSAFLRLTDS